MSTFLKIIAVLTALLTFITAIVALITAVVKIPQESAPTVSPNQPVGGTNNSVPQSVAPESNSLDGWVICWHGKFGHEYLIAYPEATLKQGLDLNILLQQPWGGGAEYLPNDSVKMCLYKDVWYGEQDTPWFPYASYMILKDDGFLLCKDSPGCSGDTWTLTRTENPPYMQALMKQTVGSDIQVLGYK